MCVESTATGRNARPGAVAQGSWRQERLALQPQLFPLEGTLAGYAVCLVAWWWYGVPSRAVVPLRAVVS